MPLWKSRAEYNLNSPRWYEEPREPEKNSEQEKAGFESGDHQHNVEVVQELVDDFILNLSDKLTADNTPQSRSSICSSDHPETLSEGQGAVRCSPLTNCSEASLLCFDEYKSSTSFAPCVQDLEEKVSVPSCVPVNQLFTVSADVEQPIISNSPSFAVSVATNELQDSAVTSDVKSCEYLENDTDVPAVNGASSADVVENRSPHLVESASFMLDSSVSEKKLTSFEIGELVSAPQFDLPININADSSLNAAKAVNNEHLTIDKCSTPFPVDREKNGDTLVHNDISRDLDSTITRNPTDADKSLVTTFNESETLLATEHKKSSDTENLLDLSVTNSSDFVINNQENSNAGKDLLTSFQEQSKFEGEETSNINLSTSNIENSLLLNTFTETPGFQIFITQPTPEISRSKDPNKLLGVDEILNLSLLNNSSFACSSTSANQESTQPSAVLSDYNEPNHDTEISEVNHNHNLSLFKELPITDNFVDVQGGNLNENVEVTPSVATNVDLHPEFAVEHPCESPLVTNLNLDETFSLSESEVAVSKALSSCTTSSQGNDIRNEEPVPIKTSVLGVGTSDTLSDLNLTKILPEFQSLPNHLEAEQINSSESSTVCSKESDLSHQSGQTSESTLKIECSEEVVEETKDSIAVSNATVLYCSLPNENEAADSKELSETENIRKVQQAGESAAEKNAESSLSLDDNANSGLAGLIPAPSCSSSSILAENFCTSTDSSRTAMENNPTNCPNSAFGYDFDENVNPFETRCKLGNTENAPNDNSPRIEVDDGIFAIPKPISQKRKKTKSSTSEQDHTFDTILPGPDVACDSGILQQSGSDFPSASSGSASSSFLVDDDEDTPKFDECEFKDADPAFLQKLSKGNRRRVDKVSTCTKSKDAVTSQDCAAQVKMTESFEAVVKEVENISTRSIEGSLPNQSEAGPDVAQFTEEEFRTAASFFKDPAAFEFLQKAGNSKTLQKSALARLSLYVKFDPLLKNGSPICKHSQDSAEPAIERSQPIDCESEAGGRPGPSSQPMEEPETTVLIDFNSSPFRRLSQGPNERTRDVHSEPDLVSSHCQEQKMFTEDEVNQALKMQDLLYQEKLLKKDKALNEIQKAHDKERIRMSNQIATLKEAVNSERVVAQEVAKLVDNWLQSKENQRIEMMENNQKLTKERDQALEDLQNVESAFSDLHRRYEKTKGVLEEYKQQEEHLRQQLEESQNKIKKQEQMYDMLRSRTEEKLDSANVEIETARKSGEAELAALKAQLKKAEMRITSLEKGLEQKSTENAELSNICDELIAKVGKV